MSLKLPEEFEQFDVQISLENPLENYEKILQDKLKVDAIMSNDMMARIWKKISTTAQETVWQILFENNSNEEQMEKAAARLLKNLKDDSCFYGPWSYNDWIPKVRDELLRRHMFEFWKNIIVGQELGPAWARDCDLFEDSNDPEPANFYEFNGCKAPWLKDKESEGNKVSTTSTNAIQLKPISLETPLEDYKCNMDIQSATTPEDPNAYNTIFANVRDTIWHLLFKDSKDFIDNESYEKAASLLRQYKKDACLYSPHDYNEWITKGALAYAVEGPVTSAPTGKCRKEKTDKLRKISSLKLPLETCKDSDSKFDSNSSTNTTVLDISNKNEIHKKQDSESNSNSKTNKTVTES
ncbi:uncharacterized protein [Musca autumnalis]|uniref:uncharacterized protein n=1 Tax=Musca autumnalis TaxID=221902 RepID=UPI003CF48D82